MPEIPTHPASSHSPDEPPLGSVHACFVALVEGRRADAERFAEPVRRAAERLFEGHRELERAGLPEPSPTGAGVPQGELAAGRRVGAYEIESLLGRGAIGEVYAAREAATGRRVALKLLPRAISRAGDARIDREARALAALEHPGIARLYASAIFEIDGERRRAIAMELVRGARTLGEWRAATGPSQTRCVETLAAVADAVAYAHGRGVIHCDLKPGNILVDEHGRAVVIDFGISRIVEEDGDPCATVSMLGSRVAGTLAYIAPESLEPGAAADVRADIHALGAILYELLANRPFRRLDALTLPQRLARIASDAPPRLRDADRAVDGDLDRIVARATERDPARRYASASQLAADLRAHLAGRPVLPELQGPGERLWRGMRRHQGAVALVAFIATLLVTTTVVSLRFAGEARRDARLANLAAAARAIDACDLLLLAQHVSALGEPDGTIERALLDRALAMQGRPLLRGDFYGLALLPEGGGFVANGHLAAPGPGGRAHEPTLEPSFTSRFDRAPDGSCTRRWKRAAGESLIHGLAVAADGSLALDLDDDGRLRAWRTADGAPAASIAADDFAAAGAALAIRDDGLVADGRDIVMLRKIGGTGVGHDPAHDPVRGPAHDQSHETAHETARGTEDDTARGLAHELARVDPGVGAIRALAFSPKDAGMLVVAGQRGAVLVDLETARVAERLATPPAMQVAAAWNAAGTRVFVAGWDRTLRAYDLGSPDPVWTARGHRDSIWSIAWLDHETLATAGADGTVRLWNARDGAPVAAIPASRDVIWNLVHDAALGELLVVSRGETSAIATAAVRAWAGMDRRGAESAVLPSGAVAEPRADGTVRFQASAGRGDRALVPAGDGPAERVALARDGALLVALRGDGTISLVETATGCVRWATRALATDDMHESNGIPSLALDAAGGRVLVASRAFQCVALSLDDGRELWRSGFGAGCVAVAASPASRRVVACDRDGVVALLDARDGRVLRTARRQRTRVAAVAVSDDGARIVAACTDGSLRILDAGTLDELLYLSVASVALRSVWIAPDGIHTVDQAGVERVR